MTAQPVAGATAGVSLVRFPPQAGTILRAPDEVFVLRGDVTRGPVGSIAPAGGAGLPAAPDTARELRILHLNDLHGQVTRPTPYSGEQPVLSRVAWYLAQPDERPTLFFSAGDELSGSVLDGLLDDTDPCHVTYRLYSRLGMNAAAVGNHDLDRGQASLAWVAAQALFPLLAANLVGSGPLEAVLSPGAIFVAGGLRVGVVGLVTAAQLRHRPEETWKVTDPAGALLNLLPALQPLVDVVIVLSHLGYRRDGEGANVAPLGDVELARCIPPGEVHLIIGGHSHHALNRDGLAPTNVVNGIPIVQAGDRGQAVGEVCLTWRPTPDGGRVAVDEARLIQVSDLQTDERFENQEVQPLIRRARPRLARVIGRVEPLDALTSSNLRREIDAGESVLANFVTDALLRRCRARGLAVNLTMIDASILTHGLRPGAPLTVEDWFRVMPFADAIRLYRVSGQQLMAFLVDNAIRLRRPDEPRTERGFVHFSGDLRYVMALGRTRDDAAILSATVRGEPLAAVPYRRYTVACNSHFREAATAWERTVSTFGGRLISLRDWSHEDTELSLRDEIIAYCESIGGVTAAGGAARDGRVRVVQDGPADGTSHEYHLLLDQPALS
jgi:2',3'-cyclic-nucleotide 2'-phosphodiesterase (5'-nucleotidase family)